MTGDTWSSLLTEDDRARMARARFGRRIGAGSRGAVLVIDCQNDRIGPPPGSTAEYPSACETGKRALTVLPRLLAAARTCGAPVIYTRFVLKRDGSDIGVYGRKRDLLTTEGWCLEGSEGAEIASTVAPVPGDVVLDKKKPSAFFGTPLLSLLIDRQVDTLFVTCGATSNCVRATVVDAMSYNFRTLVVEDCVFDRFDVSHRTALFDMDRQYADVIRGDQAVAYFESQSRESAVS